MAGCLIGTIDAADGTRRPPVTLVLEGIKFTRARHGDSKWP